MPCTPMGYNRNYRGSSHAIALVDTARSGAAAVVRMPRCTLTNGFGTWSAFSSHKVGRHRVRELGGTRARRAPPKSSVRTAFKTQIGRRYLSNATFRMWPHLFSMALLV